MININYESRIVVLLKSLKLHYLRRLLLLPYRFVSDIIWYVRVFWLALWMKLFVKINYGSNRENLNIQLPNYKYPLIVRKWTSDTDVFKQIFIKREYNYKFWKGYNPRFIIDCWANTWYSTVYFANRFPDAKIYAIEPEKTNFDVLVKNTKSYKNIEVFEKWIRHKTTNLKISNPEWRKWSFQLIETDEKVWTISAITINDLLKRSGLKKVDILKIDIEWAEKEVFENNSDDWLKTTDIIFLEVHERYKKWVTKSVLDITKKYNYNQSISWENLVFRK